MLIRFRSSISNSWIILGLFGTGKRFRKNYSQIVKFELYNRRDFQEGIRINNGIHREYTSPNRSGSEFDDQSWRSIDHWNYSRSGIHLINHHENPKSEAQSAITDYLVRENIIFKIDIAAPYKTQQPPPHPATACWTCTHQRTSARSIHYEWHRTVSRFAFTRENKACCFRRRSPHPRFNAHNHILRVGIKAP